MASDSHATNVWRKQSGSARGGGRQVSTRARGRREHAAARGHGDVTRPPPRCGPGAREAGTGPAALGAGSGHSGSLGRVTPASPSRWPEFHMGGGSQQSACHSGSGRRGDQSSGLSTQNTETEETHAGALCTYIRPWVRLALRELRVLDKTRDHGVGRGSGPRLPAPGSPAHPPPGAGPGLDDRAVTRARGTVSGGSPGARSPCPRVPGKGPSLRQGEGHPGLSGARGGEQGWLQHPRAPLPPTHWARTCRTRVGG